MTDASQDFTVYSIQPTQKVHFRSTDIKSYCLFKDVKNDLYEDNFISVFDTEEETFQFYNVVTDP